MTVIGGVRAPTPPNDYTMVTCVWFDGAQMHQAAIHVEELDPTTATPSPELAAYVAKREADARARAVAQLMGAR